jgi:hypothetical protein
MSLIELLPMTIRLRRLGFFRGCAELLPRSEKNPFPGLPQPLALISDPSPPSFSPVPQPSADPLKRQPLRTKLQSVIPHRI